MKFMHNSKKQHSKVTLETHNFKLVYRRQGFLFQKGFFKYLMHEVAITVAIIYTT